MTLDKWQRMTEWFMTALALVFLFAYSWEVLARTHILLCEMVINIIWMAFIVDYVVSILLASGGSAQRAQPYRWHGGAWAHHTVHMLQRDITDVYRRPCRIGCGTWGSRRFHHRFRRGDMVVVRDRHHSRLWRFVPVTWQGRCIAIGLMITGVALIGIVTATLASWIVDRVRDETDKRADEAESETEQLRHNVRELTDTVNQLRDDIAQLRRL